MSPQENRIGRVCKVGKESLFGLLKAIELFVNQDYDETLRRYDAKADTITKALSEVRRHYDAYLQRGGTG